jgi:hypothetical protein
MATQRAAWSTIRVRNGEFCFGKRRFTVLPADCLQDDHVIHYYPADTANAADIGNAIAKPGGHKTDRQISGLSRIIPHKQKKLYANGAVDSLRSGWFHHGDQIRIDVHHVRLSAQLRANKPKRKGK